MQENGLGKYGMSFGLSLAITSILSSLLVLVKELNENTVMAWMKHATSHHWITHGIIDIIAFVAIGFLLAKMNGGKGLDVSSKNLPFIIAGSVALSSLIISVFYLID